MQYLLNKNDQAEIEKGYELLFKTLLPKTLSLYSNLPYEHTSPLSNWGKDDFYNHGTQHYWGVWHGSDPMSDFANKIGRFNAEFGFQSFPEFSTLQGFSSSKDWDLNSSVMKHHQKSYVGNGMILKHAKRLYGKPKSFEEFVYFSQLTQSHAVTSAIGGHLLDAPRCMGTLYWQLNDCWPGPTWSSIDYYGSQKALHYHVKELFEHVTAVKQSQEEKERIFLVANNQATDSHHLVGQGLSTGRSGCHALPNVPSDGRSVGRPARHHGPTEKCAPDVCDQLPGWRCPDPFPSLVFSFHRTECGSRLLLERSLDGVWWRRDGRPQRADQRRDRSRPI